MRDPSFIEHILTQFPTSASIRALPVRSRGRDDFRDREFPRAHTVLSESYFSISINFNGLQIQIAINISKRQLIMYCLDSDRASE